MKMDLEKEQEIINANKVINLLKDDFKVKTYIEALHVLNSQYEYIKQTKEFPIKYKTIGDKEFYLIPPSRKFDSMENKFYSTGWDYEYRYDGGTGYGCLALCNFGEEAIKEHILNVYEKGNNDE